ncbi:MAG TPA: hypothetical protein VK929_03530 [Longimicrobiales bacterium]|nr:hypothetical protein [Longimicrobiales bacterium]
MTRDQWRWVGLAVFLALAVGAVLYFGGRWQERSYAADERAERIEELDAVRSDLAAAQDRIRLLRARSLLFETALDLDRRNFGTANAHLHAAAAELEAVRESVSDMDTQALQALQRDIAATDLSLATDLEVQRTRVLDFLARLDALLPEEQVGPSATERPEPPMRDTTG